MVLVNSWVCPVLIHPKNWISWMEKSAENSNFPQKYCLRTRKLSILQCVLKKVNRNLWRPKCVEKSCRTNLSWLKENFKEQNASKRFQINQRAHTQWLARPDKNTLRKGAGVGAVVKYGWPSQTEGWFLATLVALLFTLVCWLVGWSYFQTSELWGLQACQTKNKGEQA